MVDDDVSTLLKLDEKGFHAGGTVQAGSRPLFVASGGFTVNPPDLASAGEKLRTLFTAARDTVQDAAHDLPDPSPTVGDAIDAIRATAADLRTMLADLGSDLPDAPDLRASASGLAAAIPSALPTPDPDRLAADARELTLRARQAVGLAPRSLSLAQRIPRWLPGGLLAVASVAIAGAVIVLWDPVHGADRRRRLRARFDALRGRISATDADEASDTFQGPVTPPMDLAAIPIEPGGGTPIVGVQVHD